MRNRLGCLLRELSALKSALKARSHHALYRDKGSQQPWTNSRRKGERAVLGGDTFAMAWECKQKRQEDKQTRGCRSRFSRKNMSLRNLLLRCGSHLSLCVARYRDIKHRLIIMDSFKKHGRSCWLTEEGGELLNQTPQDGAMVPGWNYGRAFWKWKWLPCKDLLKVNP